MSCSRGIYAETDVENALTSQTIAAAANADGEIIDTQEAEALLFAIGLADLETGEGAIIKIEHGDDAALADAADAGSADVLVASSNNESGGTSTVTVSYAAGDRDGVYKIGYVGSKRYARVNVAVTGGDGVTASGVAIKQYLHRVLSGAS